MRMRPVIALAAGGTGGHVFPAAAVAASLATRGIVPVLFTDRRGTGFGGAVEVVRVHGAAITGMGPIARATGIARLALGFAGALVQLRRRRPDAVIGFGGYASVPTVLAASLLGIPTALHEQNAVLGRGNRLLAGRVRRIATGFERIAGLSAKNAGKVVRVGMPVRPAFAGWTGEPYAAPADDGPIRLLVLGGSQGAQVFSTLVPDALSRLAPDLRARLAVTQQCRPETLEATRAAYDRLAIAAELSSFFADVPERLAKAHLVIARSGASTVAELAVVGRPAILVPYPYATDDHQTANARALAEAGAAWLMPQADLTAERLAERLSALLADPPTLHGTACRARELGIGDAAERLADLALSLVRIADESYAAPLERRGAA
ncbi:MAG: undecaprenyldiphospho-muramoylpentapeptide beta-N-acetylglucosaminyltransferase [Rhodospirillales bacterium]